MAGFIKKTTGLTGLAADPLASQKLQRLYKATLKALGSMPGSYPYRRSTEQLINDRLNIIQTELDPVQVEKKINSGQLEELVLQAEREFHLAKNMLIWKTWEPLIEEAPKNQWKWPV